MCNNHLLEQSSFGSLKWWQWLPLRKLTTKSTDHAPMIKFTKYMLRKLDSKHPQVEWSTGRITLQEPMIKIDQNLGKGHTVHLCKDSTTLTQGNFFQIILFNLKGLGPCKSFDLRSKKLSSNTSSRRPLVWIRNKQLREDYKH